MLRRNDQRDQDDNAGNYGPADAAAPQREASRYVRRCAHQHTGAYRRARLAREQPLTTSVRFSASSEEVAAEK